MDYTQSKRMRSVVLAARIWAKCYKMVEQRIVSPDALRILWTSTETRAFTAPMELLQICRSWTQIAVATPSLWTDILVESPSEVFWNLIEAIFQSKISLEGCRELDVEYVGKERAGRFVDLEVSVDRTFNLPPDTVDRILGDQICRSDTLPRAGESPSKLSGK
ncbi:hypothetical protein FB45DRAFT_867971 [Roridomyces roridus]|uniref:F-box domain-containing protein n=1 Tax=Roridomyces roridus TaxID=1738132 RepID=A0AAD7FN69_9AGAR|nr:hypothetical protein FB45DRAFT_867971 [Roridomyces roridus]